jgi:SAM-dependent methyltransferase
MKYSKMLRELFSGTTLNPGDLLLLESFQIPYLPDRVPQKEFATLIRKYPYIKDFLVAKDPSITNFLSSLLKDNKETTDDQLIAEYCDEAVWEIADLIVYNKLPELYDKVAGFNWAIGEITAKETLAGKVVADVGAGSGMLAFMLATYAQTVYAIEPLNGFRTFIKQKAVKDKFGNVFVIDGFLDSIPFPDNTLDILFTSNAIGWNIEKELQEIERVVKRNGQAIHIMRVNEDVSENPVHVKLVSDEWNYAFTKTQDINGLKLKYYKTVIN